MKGVEHNLSVKFEQILALVLQCNGEEKQALLRELISDSINVTLASEKSLSKDWLSQEEDEAWKDL
jgi:hypothetical protein